MRAVTHPEFVSWRGSLDAEVLELWRAGRNTREIAGAMFFRESVIANRLPGILERARQNQEWNFDNICNGVRGTQCNPSKETE